MPALAEIISVGQGHRLQKGAAALCPTLPRAQLRVGLSSSRSLPPRCARPLTGSIALFAAFSDDMLWIARTWRLRSCVWRRRQSRSARSALAQPQQILSHDIPSFLETSSAHRLASAARPGCSGGGAAAWLAAAATGPVIERGRLLLPTDRGLLVRRRLPCCRPSSCPCLLNPQLLDFPLILIDPMKSIGAIRPAPAVANGVLQLLAFREHTMPVVRELNRVLSAVHSQARDARCSRRFIVPFAFGKPYNLYRFHGSTLIRCHNHLPWAHLGSPDEIVCRWGSSAGR